LGSRGRSSHEVLGLVDDAHPTAAEYALDLVAGHRNRCRDTLRLRALPQRIRAGVSIDGGRARFSIGRMVRDPLEVRGHVRIVRFVHGRESIISGVRGAQCQTPSRFRAINSENIQENERDRPTASNPLGWVTGMMAVHHINKGRSRRSH
jgi:hypothetical protein